jgi:hypothetical protein
MSSTNPGIAGERLTRNGEVLVTRNHLALLHGLRDRPDGIASSRNDWIQAARPYFTRISTGDCNRKLLAATRTISRAWISASKSGRNSRIQLTDRGRSIAEGKLRYRIAGCSTYRGLSVEGYSMLHLVDQEIEAAFVREAVSYAHNFGLPLGEPPRSRENRETVYAVTSGFDRPFHIKCREELEFIGPRSWHLDWTRAMIDNERVPQGYLTAFDEYEDYDVLTHLQEVRAKADGDIDAYVRAYRGKPLLSQRLTEAWLASTIYFGETDCDEDSMKEYIRNCSPTHKLAIDAVRYQRISWRHPDTGRSIGSVFKRQRSSTEAATLVVTSAAALSCLQRYWNSIGAGLRVETRYVPE